MSEQQQGIGGQVVSAGASLLGKKVLWVIAPILLVFLLPMCSMVDDPSNPPFTGEQIELFGEVAQDNNLVATDLMVFFVMSEKYKVNRNDLNTIASRFKYTVTFKVIKEVKKVVKGKIVIEEVEEIVEEERFYTLEQVLQHEGFSKSEAEEGMKLSTLWYQRLGFVLSGDLADLPDNYVIPSSEFIWPVPTLKYITSRYGPRWDTMHYGVDIAGLRGQTEGAPIVSIADGVVSQVNANPNTPCGLNFRIKHTNGYESRYCHVSVIGVTTGQEVSKGQVVAAVGNTGTSTTGAHLHLEIKNRNGVNIDPLPYVISTKPN